MKRLAWMLATAALAVADVAWAQQAISVMALGDSITAGTTPGGYRGPLCDALTTKYGLTVTTVGTQTDTSLKPGQQAHEGHGGWRIYQLADKLLSVEGVDPSAHSGYWLDGGHNTGRSAIHPQFVLLSAGINDINGMIGDEQHRPMNERGGEILTALKERQTNILKILTTERPDATILVAGCIPYANGLLNEKETGATPASRAAWAKEDGVSEAQELGVNHWVILFNKWIKDVQVPELQKAGKKVYFVDLYSQFILPDGSVRGWKNKPPESTNGPAGYGDYGLHPNEFGYKLMGEAWAKAIHERLTPVPVNQP